MTVAFSEAGTACDERVVALFEPIVDLRHGAAAAYDVVWAGEARYEARRLAAFSAIGQMSATLRAHSLFFIEAAPRRGRRPARRCRGARHRGSEPRPLHFRRR